MKTTTPLIETLLPIRHRMVRDTTVGTYNIPAQTREYSIDRRLLPEEVRASDGGSDLIKISDKSIDLG